MVHFECLSCSAWSKSGLLFVMLALLVAGLALALPARAQNLPPAAGNRAPPASSERLTNPAPPAGDAGVPTRLSTQEGPPYRTYKTPYEFHLTLLTIALAVGMALILSIMAWKSGIGDDFVRSFMVVIIVFAALFLVVAGYSDKQTAPVFGLLGTIAGYIFGRTQQLAAEGVSNGGTGNGSAGKGGDVNGGGGDGPVREPKAEPARE
jgi:hypothetical protein